MKRKGETNFKQKEVRCIKYCRGCEYLCQEDTKRVTPGKGRNFARSGKGNRKQLK